MLASWQLACLLFTAKCIGALFKKNWCALFERQFQSIILVTKVLKLRTFLFELYVLISTASVQTPLSLQKKKNNLGEAWTLQFFSRRGGFCTLAIIRDFKMPRRRRQRERQKSNRLKRQNNNSAHASRFFVHFFAVTARLRRENA